MFSDLSEVCEVLDARLKKVQTIMKKGCEIGNAMFFDSKFGELVILIHHDLKWYNDDDRKGVHIQLQGKTYKGFDVQKALYELKQAYSI